MQETTKRMIFLLAARAEKIAAQAWDLNTAKSRDVERAARELVEQLHDFATGFATLSDRVADDVSVGETLAEGMVALADKLLKLGRATDAADGTTTELAQLRPLAANLTTLAGRQEADALVARDIASLAGRAAQLAERSQAMTTPAGVRGAGRTALELHHALRSIADEAGAVSVRMTAEAALVKAALTETAAGAQAMAVRAHALKPTATDAPTKDTGQKGGAEQEAIVADRLRQGVRPGSAASGPAASGRR
jgi:hypothetical protein